MAYLIMHPKLSNYLYDWQDEKYIQAIYGRSIAAKVTAGRKKDAVKIRGLSPAIYLKYQDGQKKTRASRCLSYGYVSFIFLLYFECLLYSGHR